MTGKVYFIGAGPGDPELLTIKAKEIIARADVIVYAGSLVNKKILSYALKGARLVNSASRNLQEIASEIITAARQDLTVARIHSGDPSMYGAIAEQITILEKENIPCEVIPGVSSVFAAAASCAIEYTLPEVTQTLILTRRTGRTPVPEKESLSSLAGHQASMAIFLSIGMIEETVKDLMAGGYPSETPVVVVYRASWPDEKCVKGTLATIAAKVMEEGIKRQALILVGEAVGRRVAEPSKLYAPDFSHGYRVARKNVREGMAVVAITRRGWHTGRKILGAIDDAVLFLPAKFREEVQEPRVSFYRDAMHEIEQLFKQYKRIILIMATGIAVRAIAPLLTSKWEDPAVVTMDDAGRNIISLLAGHWGGANELAEKLTHITGGNPVITTESDVMGFPSIDVIIKTLTAGTVPHNPVRIKEVQAAILEDQSVGFYPRELGLFRDMHGHPNIYFFDTIEDLMKSRCSAGVIVTHKAACSIQTDKKIICIHPRNLTVGIGCHKGISAQEIKRGIEEVFAQMDLSLSSIAKICSIAPKKDEKGLCDYANQNNISLEVFTAQEISRVGTVSPGSSYVREAMGVEGVAEPCAMLGAFGGKLLVRKIKLTHMTVAVAEISLKEIIQNSGETGDE